jgi:T-complex protein 1 subunit epsilon
MSLTFDEHGRPFLIVREQEKKSRLTGLDAQKVRMVEVKSPFICV